jgi:cysteinyl-tRNA synthetase
MAIKFLGDSIDLHCGGEDLMFPHHENEIAQSESASGKPFARHWMHVRFLLVEGRKMSKSEGNFYTLRDLLLKGYRASAIRFLLISVPYRHQMNFTFESLTESTNAIERLRTFHQRMLKGPWPETATQTPGEFDDSLMQQINEARFKYTAALANDLNTAEARAAIFDMVRVVNSAADAGTLTKKNVDEVLSVLDLFDGVFAVLKDNDAEITRSALAWAGTEGKLGEASPELVTNFALSDADIEALVAERTQAKKTRNFARADAIRNDLLAKGVLIEDSKDGVRWRRK